MTDRLDHLHRLTRRGLLGSAAATAALGLTGAMPGRALAADAPWAERPPGEVDELNFVVWTYGDIYTKIAQKFQDDWGVKVNSTISSFNDHPTKLMTMYAGGETIDVSQSSPFSFPNFISQDLVEPLDGLPGAAEYAADFTGFTKQVAIQDGKLMALPYFSAVWVWNYYTDLLEKTGVEPFTTYDELLEQCRKAKKDGVSEYPILWVAGVGLEQLPGTWYSMTWNQGGVFFDKEGNHQLGPGSVARETLKWWAQTFKEELADPESLKVQFTSSAKAFSAGKNLYRGPQPPLRPQHRQRPGPVADRGQGQGLGLAERGQHDRGHPRLLPVHRQPRQGVGLEAAPVSRRQDQGRPIHPGHQPRPRRDAGLGLPVRDAERRRPGRLEALG